MNKRAKRRLRGKLRSLKLTDFFTLEQTANLIHFMQTKGIDGPYSVYICGKQFDFS